MLDLLPLGPLNLPSQLTCVYMGGEMIHDWSDLEIFGTSSSEQRTSNTIDISKSRMVARKKENIPLVSS